MSTIFLAKNLIYHERSKHIDIMFYFIRKQHKDVKLLHAKTNEQVPNIFTKPLKVEIFKYLT